MEHPVLTLSEEQLLAVAAHPGEPVRLIDPTSRQTYVLVRAEVFERVRELLADDHPAQAYPAIDRAFAAGWDDPKMDEYDW